MTTQTLVGRHTTLEVQPAEDKDDFHELRERAGIVSVSLPSETNPCALPKGAIRERTYEISDVRLEPCRTGNREVLSVNAIMRAAQLSGRATLTILEAVAFLHSRESRHMELPDKCKGILILGSGFGKMAPILRKRSDGKWILQSTHACNTDGFCYLTRRG